MGVSGGHSAMAVERSGFNSKGNWYESREDGSYRYWNIDGGEYEYDGDGHGHYSNPYGTGYSGWEPYESYFDYNNGTREDIILDHEVCGESIIKQFEDFTLEDEDYEEYYELDSGQNHYEADEDDVQDEKGDKEEYEENVVEQYDYEEDYDDYEAHGADDVEDEEGLEEENEEQDYQDAYYSDEASESANSTDSDDFDDDYNDGY